MAVSLETWLLYLGTLLVFFATPGPSHLLMLSVSLANGARRATATAAGDLSANALQMLAAGLGLGAVLLASETAFTVVKWAGVGYLVWMGVQKIRAAGRGAARDGPRATLGRLWLLGFLTSAANPKAVVFFAALFPQFIDPAGPLTPQLLILGATYIVIDGSFLAAYGIAAGWVKHRLGGPARAWLDRVAGGALIAAAALLALKTARDA